MYELVEAYTIPERFDADVFGAIAWNIFDMNQPRDTGKMASCSTYEVDGNFLWFYNDCIYGAYQNYETCLSGWFTDGTAYAVEHAITICDKQKIYNEEYNQDYEDE